MIRAYKVRLYPTKEQMVLIEKTIGCCRKMYNEMLNERKQAYEQLKDNREKLYHYKYRTPAQIKQEFSYMNEVDSQAFNWVQMNIKTAYTNFFKSVSGVRKGGKIGFPTFHKKQNFGAYTTQVISIFDNKHLKIQKLGKVKYSDKRTIVGKIKHATISKTPDDKYYCSILVENNNELPEKVQLNNNSKVIGLDMSLSNFYVDSFGNSPEYIKRYKSKEKKLIRLQKIESRRQKHSNRRKKLRKSINLINNYIKNQRLDFTHKLSRKLVEENDVIVVESLSLKNMSGSLKLGKSISDLGYGMFITQLQYKCDWYGKHLVIADKWFASSKICHICGHKYKDLTLKDRKWVCPNCGAQIDRDENAAINLKNLGMGYIHECMSSQNISSAVKHIECN
jgi:putative transposase